ncbi:NADH-quinone oxidoreductase subunit C [Streptomyces sp. MA25(2023)]|uniref:NADH-quinone oxidoreductase subunit C n=1 Tax=Streptomyces sp. MA25(2023) TaxID=3055078 RepID=UPI0025B271B5|nr:NADH-quinone oxidoreductase subunit C [Streptomyces sp. MA25(2023)]MDN3252467.1 NADH-quinone oxidoreductase subunit C [Streptomyces sp. MA25(2023)]
MTAVGWLPADATELFGTQATAEESYDVLTVDVPPSTWISALETARDRLGCTYFDWLSAVDEPGTGFLVSAHVVALGPVRRLLLRTTVPHGSPALPSAVTVYAGAAWHERETHEMFGVAFEDHPALDHLLLPEGFEGHPLRKDFVLAARVAKAWPGAKEPGESDHGGPRRRQMLPPGVPDPNEWGPLKGQLPPAPARPARGAGRAAGERPARAAGDRPVRRARTAAEGSASQSASGGDVPVTPRRSRTAAEGSASQAAPAPRRARSASEGSASQRTGAPEAEPTTETDARTGTGQAAAGPAAPTRRARTAGEGSASQRAASDARTGDTGTDTRAPGPTDDPTGTPPGPEAPAPAPKPTAPATPRSPDAPWHHARPAFDNAEPEPEPGDGAERRPDSTSDEPNVSDEPIASDEPQNSDDPQDSENNDNRDRNEDQDRRRNQNQNRPTPPGGPQ